jgi:hypothetical protein
VTVQTKESNVMRSIGILALLTVAAVACSTGGITPGESLFSNTLASCRTLAFEEGLEVVDMGEAEAVAGGASVQMRVRDGDQVEERTCMFREGYDNARFVTP